MAVASQAVEPAEMRRAFRWCDRKTRATLTETERKNFFVPTVGPGRESKTKIEGPMSQRASGSRLFLESIVETLREPIVVVDADNRIMVANQGFRDAFHGAAIVEDTVLWDLDGGMWSVRALHRLLDEELLERDAVEARAIEVLHPSLGKRMLTVSARRLHHAPDGEESFLLAIHDVTEHDAGRVDDLERRVRDRTRDLEEQRRAALDLVAQAEQAKAEAVKTSVALQQSEGQLRQSQKMEAVGRLAGGVAHDFNNLLTAIFSFSSFVMEDMDPSAPSYADMLEIEKAANRAQGLTSQLLAFSRKSVVTPVVLNPNVTLEELKRLLERVLGEHIEVAAHIDAPVGSIRVDPSALEQVVINLGVNARDAMPDGGRLMIETDRVDVDADADFGAAKGTIIPPGEYVRVALTDTGTGIDEKIQQHIFEPFFTTKEHGKGTGLGLSTVYGIVQQAGGFISVYSEVGKGTTFRIYFPRLPTRAEDPPSAAQLPLRPGNETILVVEDDEQIRSLCQRALERLGYQVRLAENGVEALALCARGNVHFHLVLTDIVMPQLSGTQLATRLVKILPGAKVLFMSGYTPNAIAHFGGDNTGVMLLQKPFGPEDVGRKVREVLDTDDFYIRAFENELDE